jgi:hypothetical protein
MDTEMRKRLIWTLALATAFAVAVAGVATSANKPTVIQVGDLKLTFNGGFSPKKLPKKTLAPISLNVSGKIQKAGGARPPALKSFVLETDKNGSVDAKGLAACKGGRLEATTTSAAEKACKKSIVGKGKTDVIVEFAEQAPINLKSDLVLFNGGVKGGKTTLFIHAYLSSPIAAAIVTDVKIKRKKNGRYGVQSIASIPKIANGAGSVTNFSLTINKKFSFKGKKKSYLSAKCPDGHLDAQGEAIFADGTKAKGSVVRACTPKG